MRAEHYTVRTTELAGWPVRITTYRIGSVWHAKADNVSPGANVASAQAGTREEAEAEVVEKAQARLAATRRVY